MLRTSRSVSYVKGSAKRRLFGIDLDSVVSVAIVRERGDNYSLFFLLKKNDKLVVSSGKGALISLTIEEAIEKLALLFSVGLKIGSTGISPISRIGISNLFAGMGAVSDGKRVRIGKVEVDAEDFPELAEAVANYDKAYTLANMFIKMFSVDFTSDIEIEKVKKALEDFVFVARGDLSRVPPTKLPYVIAGVTSLLLIPETALGLENAGKLVIFDVPIKELSKYIDISESIREIGAYSRHLINRLEHLAVFFTGEHDLEQEGHRMTFLGNYVSVIPANPFYMQLVPVTEGDKYLTAVQILSESKLDTIQEYIVTSLLVGLGVKKYVVNNGKVVIERDQLAPLTKILLTELLRCEEEGEHISCDVINTLRRYKHVLTDAVSKGKEWYEYIVKRNTEATLVSALLEKKGIAVLSDSTFMFTDEALEFFILSKDFALLAINYLDYGIGELLSILAGYLYADRILREAVNTNDYLVLKLKIHDTNVIVYHNKRSGESRIYADNGGDMFILGVATGALLSYLRPVKRLDKYVDIDLKKRADFSIRLRTRVPDVLSVIKSLKEYPSIEYLSYMGLFEAPAEPLGLILHTWYNHDRDSAKKLIRDYEPREIIKYIGIKYYTNLLHFAEERANILLFLVTKIRSPKMKNTKSDETLHLLYDSREELLDALREYISDRVLMLLELYGYERGKLYLAPDRYAISGDLGIVLKALEKGCELVGAYIVCDVNNLRRRRISQEEAIKASIYANLVTNAELPEDEDVIALMMKVYDGLHKEGVVRLSKDEICALAEEVNEEALLSINFPRTAYFLKGEELVRTTVEEADDVKEVMSIIQFLTIMCDEHTK